MHELEIIPEFRDKFFKDKQKNNSVLNNRIWWFFVSANFSIKRDLFLENKFDEDFIGWAEEDVELGYRLYKKGKKIRLTSECLAYDIRPRQKGTKSMLTKEKFISTTKNEVLLYKKHPFPEVKAYVEDRYYNSPEEFRKNTSLDLDNFIFEVKD